MFDIAWSELLLIAVVALIFIGPKELPYVLHSLGRMVGKLRRQADDFRRQFEDSVREAGYEDLHKNIQEFRSLNPANQLKDSIARAIAQDSAPKPAAPVEAAPADASASKPAASEPAPAQASPAAPAEALGAPRVENAAVEAPAEARPSSAQAHAGEFEKDRIAPAA
ncbi:MAG: Sec-independent protein translocase protein TatB [Rhodomicrobium sp.]